MDIIVILERTSVTPTTLRYVLRATVPAARQPYFADAEKVSAFPGALADDTAAFRAGAFLERVSTFDVGTLTIAQIGTALAQAQQAFQADVNANGIYNPWRFYGSTWNGTTWTVRGVN